MTCKEMFGSAVWVGKEEHNCYILRRKFTVKGAKKATLRVLGLGFFHCYINGVRVSDDLFQPLNSEYEPRRSLRVPEKEKFSGFHTYVPEYDVTHLLQNGENVMALHFGGGWYGSSGWYSSGYGFDYAKAIYRLFGEDSNGDFEFVSSMDDIVCKSFITEYKFDHKPKETHDYREETANALRTDFDDSAWEKVRYAEPLKTDYLFTDCPTDKVVETIRPVKIKQSGNYVVYDCGKNITGYPVLKIKAKYGEKIVVQFSEAIDKDDLDERYIHGQKFTVIADGNERVVTPLFLWYGFRAFSVQGNAECESVEMVCADIEQTSSFTTDNEFINWLHDTYVHTQRINMHTGTPTDCPHIERRGYTGDGQVTCRAVMHIFNGRPFYKKWMRDIADGQDEYTGKIQNTAPYISAGGGPGGWGCAIVEVPYQYYKAYGDISVLKEYYPNMLRYFAYLEGISSAGLVADNGDGEWCLGEWCTPNEVQLPPSFVNTYFYIKSLQRAIEIAKVIGKEKDIALFEKRIADKKQSLKIAYEDESGDYLGGVQAANAFALDIGLGDNRTYAKLVERYQNITDVDTGIFGTEILARVLFERGDGTLAVELLTRGKHSYKTLKDMGATTLWEYMPNSLYERSLNHPMFGAVVACFYEYLLGIQGDAGYENVTIAPICIGQIHSLTGYKTISSGKIRVSYEKVGNIVCFSITIPKNQNANFVFNGKKYALQAGDNHFSIIV